MAQIGDQVRINAHMNELRVRADQVNQLDAHGLDVEACILAEEEQDLQTIHIKELTGKLTRACTLIVSLVKQEHF